MPTIFSCNKIEAIANDLVDVLYWSNKDGYSCGMGDDQVYGCAYKALKNLLIKEFGERATEIAMNCSTWCTSNFKEQIIPAIELGIEEANQEKNYELARKMVNFIMGYEIQAYTDDSFNKEIYVYDYTDTTNDEVIFKKIPADWNAVHEYLDLMIKG